MKFWRIGIFLVIGINVAQATSPTPPGDKQSGAAENQPAASSSSLPRSASIRRGTGVLSIPLPTPANRQAAIYTEDLSASPSEESNVPFFGQARQPPSPSERGIRPSLTRRVSPITMRSQMSSSPSHAEGEERIRKSSLKSSRPGTPVISPIGISSRQMSLLSGAAGEERSRKSSMKSSRPSTPVISPIDLSSRQMSHSSGHAGEEHLRKISLISSRPGSPETVTRTFRKGGELLFCSNEWITEDALRKINNLKCAEVKNLDRHYSGADFRAAWEAKRLKVREVCEEIYQAAVSASKRVYQSAEDLISGDVYPIYKDEAEFVSCFTSHMGYIPSPRDGWDEKRAVLEDVLTYVYVHFQEGNYPRLDSVVLHYLKKCSDIITKQLKDSEGTLEWPAYISLYAGCLSSIKYSEMLHTVYEGFKKIELKGHVAECGMTFRQFQFIMTLSETKIRTNSEILEYVICFMEKQNFVRVTEEISTTRSGKKSKYIDNSGYIDTANRIFLNHFRVTSSARLYKDKINQSESYKGRQVKAFKVLGELRSEILPVLPNIVEHDVEHAEVVRIDNQRNAMFSNRIKTILTSCSAITGVDIDTLTHIVRHYMRPVGKEEMIALLCFLKKAGIIYQNEGKNALHLNSYLDRMIFTQFQMSFDELQRRTEEKCTEALLNNADFPFRVWSCLRQQFIDMLSDEEQTDDYNNWSETLERFCGKQTNTDETEINAFLWDVITDPSPDYVYCYMKRLGFIVQTQQGLELNEVQFALALLYEFDQKSVEKLEEKINRCQSALVATPDPKEASVRVFKILREKSGPGTKGQR